MATDSNNSGKDNKKKVYGNPEYSEGEDIYSRDEKKAYSDKELPANQDGKRKVNLDQELDVPGTELDDSDEKVGEEDEENNYYSLGGDDHNNLDEEEE